MTVRKLTQQQIADFQKHVWGFYHTHYREFPWRITKDAYEILVSELMLQQTQTQRVLPKYLAFLERFPTVKDLAQAPRAHVLQLWQGLGYNRRALNLQRAAQAIVTDFAGVIPSSEKELLSLPGIGPYTQSAVRAFAFEQPVIMLETNIRTVLIHEFFPDAITQNQQVSEQVLAEIAAQVLPANKSRDWYYALMDYGVHLKKLVGNLNRLSTTYTRQSQFKGSRRQVRGFIVRELTTFKTPVALATLQKLGIEQELSMQFFEGVIAELCQEGFITRKGDWIEIV